MKLPSNIFVLRVGLIALAGLLVWGQIAPITLAQLPRVVPPSHTGGDLKAPAAPSPVQPVEAVEPQNSEIAKDGSTEINVKNADIAAVVRIFSKKTKRNFILDERVKGKVSIYLPGKVTAEESLKILDSVLGLKGFTSVPLGENLWKIVPSKEARQSTIPTMKENSESGSASVVTRLLPLKFIPVDEAKELVAQLVSQDGLLSAYGGTNTLLIIDYEDNVRRLVDLIENVDVPFSNREMTIIPVKNADASEIAKKLGEILGLGENKDSKKAGVDPSSDLLRARLNNQVPPNGQPPVGMVTGAVSAVPPGDGSTKRSIDPKIIPDERTNSIIVVADDDTTARVRALINQLDSELDLSGFRFYVYQCQHADAEEIAETLAGLTGQGSGGGSKSGAGSNLLMSGDGDSAVSVNTNSRERGGQFGRTQDRLSSQKRTPGRSRGENKESGGKTSVQLGENVSITADKATNSLIIAANKSDYEKIKELLKQLDVKRRQVLVEAMLLEVGVDDSTEIGTDFLTSGGGLDGGVAVKSDFGSADQSLTSLFQSPQSMSKFSVAAASAGTLSLPGGLKIPSQSVLLSAAQANSNVNVLSAPNILTTDNEEAEIVVGQNVPFLASRSTSDANLNNTFNQIDRQDVGITLRLTPQISSQAFVTMKIFTEVSSVVNQTDLGPTTAVRTSETTVISKDGQMVVIGGLLADTSNNSDAGVPYLKDIPVLGHIFKSANEEHRKTNLLIFITPRIVQDQFDHKDVTFDKKEIVQGEIANRGVNPDRHEVLDNPALSKVTEAQQYEGPKPSTILPPESSDSGAPSQSGPNEPKASVSKSLSTDSPGVIQLKIAPKLTIPEKKAAVEASATSNRFVVLKVLKESLDVPFSWDPKSKRVGIEMPEGSSPKALEFFRPGSEYSYGKAKLRVEETHPDKTNAPSVPWYTLSPREVMSVGKELWIPTQK